MTTLRHGLAAVSIVLVAASCRAPATPPRPAVTILPPVSAESAAALACEAFATDYCDAWERCSKPLFAMFEDDPGGEPCDAKRHCASRKGLTCVRGACVKLDPARCSGSTHTSPSPPSPKREAPADLWKRVVEGDKLVPIFASAAEVHASEREDRPPKVGFAEVVYRKPKVEIATVTIVDTLDVPGVRDRYKDAKETVAGFPLVSGVSTSAVLVGDRFQVQVQSHRLDASERKALLQRMDLKALDALK